jgi:hypothetical protein
MNSSIQSTESYQLVVNDNGEKTERVVESIREFINQASLDTALGIGKLVIDEFYDGNLNRWRKRGPKDASLRKLARHEKLPISASCLYRSIAIYELFARLDGKTRWSRLSATHFRAVLALSEEEQIKQLDAAQENTWSTKKLEEEVIKCRKSTNGIGRPRLPKLVKSLRCIQTSIRNSESAFNNPQSIAELSHASVLLLRDELAALRSKIESYQSKLEDIKGV